jgi:hypothetical protein
MGTTGPDQAADGSDLPPLDQEAGAEAEAEAEAGRRDLKTALSSGELTLQGLFDASDSESGDSGRVAGHMHIRAALLALPHIGDTKADAILDSVGIAGDKHVDAIGSDQRKKLEEAVNLRRTGE